MAPSSTHGSSTDMIKTLLNLISEESCSKISFNAICSQAALNFSKSDHFNLGTTLVLLLQQPDLIPNKAQKMVIFVLLYDFYKDAKFSLNPFRSVFDFVLDVAPPSCKKTAWSLPVLSNDEKKFLKLLIGSHPDLLETLNAPPTALGPNLPSVTSCLPDNKKSPTCRVGVSSIISCTESSPFGEQSDILNDLLSLSDNSVPMDARSLRPEYIRPVPPLYMNDEDDIFWMNPESEDDLVNPNYHRFVLDKMSCEESQSKQVGRRLFDLACVETLNLSQKEQLRAEFELDPSLVRTVGITPAKLPDLVESNPLIAIEVLLLLMDSSKNHITEYFSVLVNMELSLHSMEVVNRLTSAVELPTEFIHLYICNCISTCETVKDKYMQNRLVRLLCVFLQSLIRNKIIDVQQLFVQVQAFCIEFTRIKEAAALFRLLKQLDGTDNEPGTSRGNQEGSPGAVLSKNIPET